MTDPENNNFANYPGEYKTRLASIERSKRSTRMKMLVSWAAPVLLALYGPPGSEVAGLMFALFVTVYCFGNNLVQ